MTSFARNSHRETGLIAAILWQLFSLMGWVILGIGLSLLIAMLLVFCLGEEVGLNYLLHLWKVEWQWLAERLNAANYYQPILLPLLQKVQSIFTVLVNKVNAISTETINTSHPVFIFFLFKVIKSTVMIISAYLKSLIIAFAVTLIRLIEVGLFFILFILMTTMALLDGLIQRDLRRLYGMRESAFRYHLARRSLMPCMKWGLLLYLAMPISLYPDYFLLPLILLFSLIVASTAKRFRKYV